MYLSGHMVWVVKGVNDLRLVQQLHQCTNLCLITCDLGCFGVWVLVTLRVCSQTAVVTG